MKLEFGLNGYDLLFLAAIFIGTTFGFLLLLTKRINQSANRFLGLVLFTIVLWIIWVLAIDINLGKYYPRWSWIPLQYSLTIGPLLYCYVRKLTQPELRFSANDLIHFSPFLLEQSVQFLQVRESQKHQIPTYDTTIFQLVNPVLQLLAICSISIYLFFALKRLRAVDRELTDQLSDSYTYQSKWLQRLLILFGLLWLAWIPYVLIDYVVYNYQLGIASYYPLYLLLAFMTIWIGAESFLRPELVIVEVEKTKSPSTQPEIPTPELLESGVWLRHQLETNLFYLDAGLTLRSLADVLDMHPNELSRIINLGTGKNFNDLINEYRIQEVIRKMQDPQYDRITLLGIAYDSGFNSKTTFNRTFKQLTGQNPANYKINLKRAPNL
ncbi:helix-turn-helix domain-containing protein [Spirosoma sp. HMF4905]|uniref:Helix-turn-helix domain-containing protein n=1 Tax=Spirosoma arboris TaxID=2682092 RepID=A0A7K1S4A2_9BACT|nr:AraC family transcriptional regulator [Spirosoma arboris]MVM28639.1 helix-turn-helix domain-containing protein [Spirosoma arboris]